jgi:hypothetical protein
MPTILRMGGYRLYFFSHEPNEPPHVHVDSGGGSTLKARLDPVELARNRGFVRTKSMPYCVSLQSIGPRCWRHGMDISAKVADERVADVRCDDANLTVDLMDGRTISVPLAWHPRLRHATPDQRGTWESCGGGYGIHWPKLDEDLSTEGLLRGAPAAKAV